MTNNITVRLYTSMVTIQIQFIVVILFYQSYRRSPAPFVACWSNEVLFDIFPEKILVYVPYATDSEDIPYTLSVLTKYPKIWENVGKDGNRNRNTRWQLPMHEFWF